jgi:hypothetical protein
MPDRVRFGVARAVVAIGCGTANVGIVAIIASKACVASIGDWRFGDIARWASRQVSVLKREERRNDFLGEMATFAALPDVNVLLHHIIRRFALAFGQCRRVGVGGLGGGGVSASFASRAVDLVNQSYRRSFSPARSHHLQPLGRTLKHRRRESLILIYESVLCGCTVPC